MKREMCFGEVYVFFERETMLVDEVMKELVFKGMNQFRGGKLNAAYYHHSHQNH